MEKDFLILDEILKKMNYSDSYREILISKLKDELSKSTLPSLTPHFIYGHLIFDEGRYNAREISEYFEDYKKNGSFKTNLEKLIGTKKP